ncbi:MAG: S-methyl-5-thioribose-1-phosphate isomerase [Bacteroidia bacterium]|nr:S-methyl-5-thioribose-1-phosphate isomerase [Bacteroidia bacterium]
MQVRIAPIQMNPLQPDAVEIVDQRWLPHRVEVVRITRWEDAATAIRDMWVRGAPLIGVTAAWGLYLAARQAQAAPDPDGYLDHARHALLATRPTAVNLAWAIGQSWEAMAQVSALSAKIQAAADTAARLAREDAAACYAIGGAGLALIQACYARTGRPVQILTHCNAGRMACIEWGTATAPMYRAHLAGIPIHVWVDETRPRNQGAHITAWELAEAGIPHTVIPDNAGGHLMQHGQVDLCLVGTDRVARNGDVANKIGTYLKALAAADNGVPFYVAFPVSTLDTACEDGLRDIPIEERSPAEVSWVQGWDRETQSVRQVLITPPDSPAANPAFDVTPARMVTGYLTEYGLFEGGKTGITALMSRIS